MNGIQDRRGGSGAENEKTRHGWLATVPAMDGCMCYHLRFQAVAP